MVVNISSIITHVLHNGIDPLGNEYHMFIYVHGVRDTSMHVWPYDKGMFVYNNGLFTVYHHYLDLDMRVCNLLIQLFHNHVVKVMDSLHLFLHLDHLVCIWSHQLVNLLENALLVLTAYLLLQN